MNNNRCVMCGAIIPEGSQVCYSCDKAINTTNDNQLNEVEELKRDIIKVKVDLTKKELPQRIFVFEAEEARALHDLGYRKKDETFIELPCIFETTYGNYAVNFYNKRVNCIDCYLLKTKDKAEALLKKLKEQK